MNDQDDVIIENDDDRDDSVVAEEHQGDVIRKLKEKLKAAEAKAREHLDGWQRAQADFLNLRKRDEEAKSEFLKFANASLILELLPVLDALSSAASGGDRGVEAIYNLLSVALKKQGLEEINSLSAAFDPRLHEAVESIPTEEKDKDHRILEVLQKGYILNGKVIRPGRVKVGEYIISNSKK